MKATPSSYDRLPESDQMHVVTSQTLFLTMDFIFNMAFNPFAANHAKNRFNPLSPHDASNHHFIFTENILNFPTTKGFRMNLLAD